MDGFFTQKEAASVTSPDGRRLSCISCGLYKHAKAARMKPYGKFKLGIMNIGEAPGETEDEVGRPWQGKTGGALRRMYEKLGVDLFEDCVNLNAVNCRPEDNRTPVAYEMDCCRAVIVQKAIAEYKPRVIVLLGGAAVYSLMGHRWKKDLGGIMKWRGWRIPDQDLGCWVCPVFHPSYVGREESGVAETIWKDDLKNALECYQREFPRNIEPRIEVIKDLRRLNEIPQIGRIAIDYETTGLKPHAAGQRIVCAAVADTRDHAWAFMMPRTREEREPLVRLLNNPLVEKVAHNLKFEEAWSVVRLRQPVRNWYWDTMLAAHIMDNRQGVTGLKFQVYVQFGVVDYASEVAPWLEAVGEGGNARNRLEEWCAKGNTGKVLEYCGRDAVYELRLAEKQIAEIGYELPF